MGAVASWIVFGVAAGFLVLGVNQYVLVAQAILSLFLASHCSYMDESAVYLWIEIDRLRTEVERLEAEARQK